MISAVFGATRFDPSGLRAKMAQSERALYPLLLEALRRTVEQAAAYARTSPLYRNHTYTLRGSIKALTVAGAASGFGNAPLLGRVAATAPWAGFVENGTRAHLIEPKRGSVLRFAQNGAIRFVRFVHHPGTKPRPYMATAQAKAQPLFERLVQQAFVRAFA